MESCIGSARNKRRWRARVLGHASPGQTRLMASGAGNTGNAGVNLRTSRCGREESRGTTPCDSARASVR